MNHKSEKLFRQRSLASICYCSVFRLPGQPAKKTTIQGSPITPNPPSPKMAIVQSQSVQAIGCPFTFKDELAIFWMSMGFIMAAPLQWTDSPFMH